MKSDASRKDAKNAKKTARKIIDWIKAHFSEEVRAIHEVKSWPDQFQALMDGEKRHEVRVMDRDYQAGDWLYVREWNPAQEDYTGRQVFREITHITWPGEFGLPDGLGVLSVR